MSKENGRYFGDLDSRPIGEEFLPKDFDQDNNLLPTEMQVALNAGLLVQATEDGKYVYFIPGTIDQKDVKAKKQQFQQELEHELQKHKNVKDY